MSEHPEDAPAPSADPPPPAPDPSPADLVPADASPFDMPSGSGVEGTELRPSPRTDERRPARRR